MYRIISKFAGSVFLLSVSLFFTYGQSATDASFSLQVSAEEEAKHLLKDFNWKEKYPDSLSVITKTRELVNYFHHEGYLLASVTSYHFEDGLAKVNMEIGKKFQWLRLSPGNIDPSLLKRIGYKERFYQDKPFKYNKVAGIMEKVLDYAEQNGYPFAHLKLDSLEIIDNQIGASLHFDPGPLIVYDTVKVRGNVRIKPRFLGDYLNITAGKPFDQRQIEGVPQALAQLPYLKVNAPSQLTFQNEESTLTLFLEKRKVNQIDGIIGFLPNANNRDQLLITGQLDIVLQNPFGTGKRIGMHWQKLNVNTQRLHIQYDHPNIWRSPLTAGIDFNFLKEDTLFTSRNLKVQLGYRLNAQSSFKAYTDVKTNNLISTSMYENATALPGIIDYDLTLYGLGFEWQNIDDVFIPRQGVRISLQAAAGNKKIIQNSGIPSELYESVKPKTFQYNVEAGFELYRPLGSRLVWFNRLKAGRTFNDQLFRNDGYRLGGLNSIRGYGENLFFASQFVYINSEARYFLDEVSFLTLFVDAGHIRRQFDVLVSDENFLPVGFGAGINFSTNAGIFNFVYALGVQEGGEGVNFNQSMIHFGYVSRF